MASSYYNHQNSTPYNSNYSSSYYSNNNSQSAAPFPLHLCCFLLTLFLFIGLSWYLSYESVVESMMDQIKIVLILSPLLLLLAVHWLSSGGGDGGPRSMPFLLSFIPDQRESFHRAGGSPWGVGLLLVLLLFMISYQSYFKEQWFPLLSR